jgi:hypothetical protein
MDKLLDIPKSKFGDENHFKWYRFQCDCLAPEDAMDVSVEFFGKHDEKKSIEIEMYLKDYGLWDRIKNVFAVIRGKWCWRGFVVREEDYKNLSDIFNPDKKFDDLP